MAAGQATPGQASATGQIRHRHAVCRTKIDQRVRCRQHGVSATMAEEPSKALQRQLAALNEAGIPDERLYVDKKTGGTVDRPGLAQLLK